MALLISAGLFIKSLRNISKVDLGITIDNVVTFGISPARSGYDSTRAYALYGRVEEACRLASKYMELLEAIGDPTLTVGLSVVAIFAKLEMGDSADALRWSQAAIEEADGDRTRAISSWDTVGSGDALSGLARCFLGHSGWREDLDRAAYGSATDPLTHVLVVAYKYVPLTRWGSRRR
jgi:hypothetical protein